MVLNGTTVRGSIVGTRLDLQEALQFAADEKVKATVSVEPLENINDIFQRMHKGSDRGPGGDDHQLIRYRSGIEKGRPDDPAAPVLCP